MVERSVAKKIFVKDLITGTFIKRPGWDPSGVLTKFGEINRVNMIGLIVSSEENSLIFDDGTASINVRSFEPLLYQPKVGEIVRLIGKVREDNGSFYIVPEIIKPTEKKWHDLHMLELHTIEKEAVKLPVEIQEDMDAGPYQKIINALAVLDKGDGADIQDIINNVKIPNTEKIIQDLLSEGEIFEVSPGRIKVLE
ncbi:MAG: hypothetical protein NDI94_05880 [Candidatus Woesearchaeota archaeon]|nr:hypothetical protein [Candidatus Woesearchaeota archaeon]